MADLAAAVEAYGGLVGSEVLGPHPEDAPLRAALQRAWQDRHRPAELRASWPVPQRQHPVQAARSRLRRGGTHE